MCQRSVDGDRRACRWQAAFITLGFVLLGLPVEAADKPVPTCALNLGSALASGFEQFRGKVLYVDFWASWCVPCLLSFPFMTELQKTDGDRGLQVVAVDMDSKAADADAFLARHPAGFAVAAVPNADCAKAFGVAAMPTSFLVDRKGMIHSVHPGFRPDDAAPLRAEIEALLAEKVAQ